MATHLVTEPAYFLRSRGKVLGPFPLARLLTMKDRGQLGRTHQVSTDRATWTAAGSLPELFAPAAEPVTFDAIEELAPRSAAASQTAAAAQPTAVPQAAWFYHAGGDQFGPTDAADLRRRLAAGDLSPRDMVWREGMENWLPAGEVPELAGSGRFGSAATQAVPDGNSGLAITGMVLGIISLVIPCIGIATAPLAVIFSGVSMSQIGRSRGRLGGRGMAIAGLTTGIIAVVGYSVYFLLIFLGLLAGPAAATLR